MRFTLALPGLFALAAALPPVSGFAAEAPVNDEPVCAPLVVFSTAELESNLVDVDGSGGISSGDHQVGQRILVDDNGQHIGDRFWIASIVNVDATGAEIERISEVVVVLPHGTVFTRKSRVAGVDQPTLVTGGTGIYAGVGGTEEIDHNGAINIYHLALECPGIPQS